MKSSTSRTTTTVLELFERLEKEGLQYALLRNYESYPDFGHDIDLVVQHREAARFKEVLAEIAREQQWDLLSECSHWHHSSELSHTIEVFRLYSLEKFEYIQIDLFHGMILCGLPFLTEGELLSERIKDNRGFWRISETHENLQRFLQLSKIPSSSEKYQRYLAHLESHVQKNPETFLQQILLRFGKQGHRTLDTLLQGHHTQSQRLFHKIRLVFIQKTLYQFGVVSVFHLLFQRFLSLWEAVIRNPCGFLLITDLTDLQMKDLSIALEHLRQKNWLIQWSQKHSLFPFLTWKEQCILERGGIVIKRTKQKTPQTITWHENDSIDTLILRIAAMLMERHTPIYRRKDLAS
jgi:hypothetical protein